VSDSATPHSGFLFGAFVFPESTLCRARITSCISSLSHLSLSLFFLTVPLAHAATPKVPQAIVEPRPITIPVIDGTDVRFSSLTASNGISQISANRIVQDNQGFMWFGSFNGLIRYDGRNLKEFSHDPKNPKSLSGISIHALFKDRDGALWVGCDQFLDRFNATTETFTRHPIPFVTHISQDTAGMLWLATPNGLFRLDPATGGIRRYQHDPNDLFSLSNDYVKASGEDREGEFWVVDGEGLDEFDRKTEKVTFHIPFEEGSARISFYEDKFGVFWIFRLTGSGLAEFDRKTNRIVQYSFGQQGSTASPPVGVTGMLEDPNGTLWLATQGAGLLRFDRDRRTFIRYRNNPNAPFSLPNNNVDDLFLDHEGLMWAGLGRNGATHFATKPASFKTIPHLSGHTEDPLVGAIYEDRNGILWAGTTPELKRIDRKSDGYTSYRLGGPGANSGVIAISEDRSGDIWVGTYNLGIFRFDQRQPRFRRYRHDPADPQSLSDDNVNRFLVDRHGTLWAAATHGLNRFDTTTEHFQTYRPDPLGNPFLTEVVEDSEGALWLGTILRGLYRFDPVTGQFTAHHEHDVDRTGTLSDNQVNSIYFDHAGAMWVGTQNGLNKFNPKTGTFSVYTKREGLPGNSVGRVMEDTHGELWMGTNNGLARLNPQSGTFTSYSTSDGLPGADFTVFGAGCKGANGEMFFGGLSGATSFFPDKVRDDLHSPPVVLTDVRLFGNPVEIGSRSPLQESISYAKRLVFSYKQNVFSLSFAALSFSNPDAIRYRYKLDRVNRDWNLVGSDGTQLTYTALPTGTYTFHVQAATRAGRWSVPEVSLRIDILPPFWATWWFRTVCIILILLSLWYAHRLRLLQIARQFDMRLEERVSERTRLARDLHDTLLQSFQGLMLRLQAVNELLPEGRAKEQLERTLQRADQAIAEGRSAVYDLRSSATATNDFAEAVKTLGDELATEESPAFHLVVEGRPRDLRPIIRDELYRITREALRNAFTHARASHVETEITYGERILRVRIRDDGVGIPIGILEQGRRGHYGLPGMRERAQQIGGTLDLWSGLNAGTEIELGVAAPIAYSASTGYPLFRRPIRKQCDL
jgi:signal transduction histidine kinase/ligand-binding sensor domain-containing protein